METTALNSLLEQHGIAICHWRTAMDSPERIERIATNDGVYWLKKSAPARGVFRYHALNFFSWMLRLPLLKAVPQPGGSQAIQTEIRRIKSLADNHINVPEIIASDVDWLLIKDVGQSIINNMKQPNTSQQTRRLLFTACLESIKALHLKQQYLSQGFIRNMLMVKADPITIAFIDFEDDPLEVMSLAEAQARDVLLLVNSTARFFVDEQDFFNATIKNFMAGHDVAMVDALRTTAQRLQWITRVPFQQLLGHDYQKLKVGILALQGI